MPKAEIIQKVIRIENTEIPLYSGEIHYWRLDPMNWRAVLHRAREMGLDCIATYVCWDFHEYEQGKYDFCGETDSRRNLIGFLDLLTEEGFWIILRPGPYIYSEWKNGGVPDWAAKYHRLHPEFQKLAKQYMQEVTQAVLPYLVTNGGRIMLWQSDNEIDPWPHWYTEALGLGKQPGVFQDFLKQNYPSIEDLNRIWGTSYTAFDQARAVMNMVPEEPVKMRRYLDFGRFTHWYVQEVAKWGVTTYRELGVDVPIYLNTYSGVGTQPWSPLESFADLVGSDIYPSLNFEKRGNEHRNFLDAVRYAFSFSRLPYIAEFQSGIWHDWLGDVGMLTASHYQMVCLSALAAGAAGWNWYMLVNRDNWYQSPINEWARVRPDLFNAFSKMMEIVKTIQPHTLEKQTRTALTFDPLQRATVRPAQNLLQAFYDAGLDYDFFDLPGGSCTKEVLFYTGGVWLAQQAQQKLLSYVKQGGHLILLGAYPYLDDFLLPCNELGIPEPDGILKGLPSLSLDLSLNTTCKSQWLFHFEKVPGKAITATRKSPDNLVAEENALQWDLQSGQEYTIGYTQTIGQGKITVIGLEPSPDLILSIHHYLQKKSAICSLTSGIYTSLFRRGNEYYVFVINSTSEDKTVVLEFDPDFLQASKQEAIDMVSGKPFKFDKQLTGFVARKNGAVIRLEGESA
ncbi:MAG: hypothetical protein CL609_22085 [Anaerolineaceae bacterium]|jgi:beta-galactosidase GanA|nr:hypothetical protein [Anaerolineaceae bacterium]